MIDDPSSPWYGRDQMMVPSDTKDQALILMMDEEPVKHVMHMVAPDIPLFSRQPTSEERHGVLSYNAPTLTGVQALEQLFFQTFFRVLNWAKIAPVDPATLRRSVDQEDFQHMLKYFEPEYAEWQRADHAALYAMSEFDIEIARIEVESLASENRPEIFLAVHMLKNE